MNEIEMIDIEKSVDRLLKGAIVQAGSLAKSLGISREEALLCLLYLELLKMHTHIDQIIAKES